MGIVRGLVPSSVQAISPLDGAEQPKWLPLGYTCPHRPAVGSWWSWVDGRGRSWVARRTGGLTCWAVSVVGVDCMTAHSRGTPCMSMTFVVQDPRQHKSHIQLLLLHRIFSHTPKHKVNWKFVFQTFLCEI